MKYLIFGLLHFLPAAYAQASCQNSDFVEMNADTVTVSIQGRGYSPPCLIVKPGTAVTIQASSGHPLQGVESPAGPKNPFFRATETVAPETHRLLEPGSYRYFCTRHGDDNGNGMAGEIRILSH